MRLQMPRKGASVTPAIGPSTTERGDRRVRMSGADAGMSTWYDEAYPHAVR